jgi:hypothetical protein
MKAAANNSIAVTGLTVVFIGLAVAFYLDLWGRPTALAVLPLTGPEFTNTATVRMSAAELFRTGGDTSGMACYSCHDEKNPSSFTLIPMELFCFSRKRRFGD